MAGIKPDEVIYLQREADSHRYDDIINCPHHVSAKRPRMPMRDRAAQFSPFKAMVGYDGCIATASRTTEEFRELGQDAREELDYKLSLLEGSLESRPVISVEYFVPDPVKDGGAYVTVTGELLAVNSSRRCLEMAGGMSIAMAMIRDIAGEALLSLADGI